jgi:hypothetical protein
MQWDISRNASVSFTQVAASSGAGSSGFDRAYHSTTDNNGIIKKQFRDLDHQHKLDMS